LCIYRKPIAISLTNSSTTNSRRAGWRKTQAGIGTRISRRQSLPRPNRSLSRRISTCHRRSTLHKILLRIRRHAGISHEGLGDESDDIRSLRICLRNTNINKRSTMTENRNEKQFWGWWKKKSYSPEQVE